MEEVVNRETYKLGKTNITIKTTKLGRGGNVLLFNMHEDESVSVKAVLAIKTDLIGSLLEIQHNGKRLITFSNLQNQLRKFDPNRMFSETGIRKTLKKYNGSSFSNNDVQLVQGFANYILKKFIYENKENKLDLLVALHNNTDGSFSINCF